MNTTHSKMNAKLRQKNAGEEPPAKGAALSAVDQAAIELQREEHEFKANFIDILKATFMWKDSPKERVRNK